MNSNRLSQGIVAMAGAMLAVATVAKEAPKKPKLGSSVPGVQIPYSSLKWDAEMALDSAASGAAFTKEAWIAAGNALQRIDLKSNKPGAPVAGLAGLCGNVLSAHGTLWMVGCEGRVLYAIDEKESKVKASIPTPRISSSVPIASTSDSIWLLADDKTNLWRVDPKQFAVVAEIRLPAACAAILAAENSIWIPCPAADKLLRLDPQTNLVDKRIEVPGQPENAVFGEGSVWVHTRKEGKVVQVDPKTNKVASTVDLGVPGVAASMAFGDGSVWLSMPQFPINRIHAATGKLVQQFVGSGGGNVFHGSNSLWLASPDTKKVLRFDPKRIVATLSE